MIPLRLLKEGDCRVLRTRNDNCWSFVVVLWKEITAKAYGSG